MSNPRWIDNLICILQKCRKNKNLVDAKRLHAHIRDNGLECHGTVGNYIVPMFVDCGSISDAQQVFNRLVHRNVHSWTSLILGYIECGKPQHALDLYWKMQEDSVHPSSYTLVALLKACVRLKDVQRGQEIHVEILQKGVERDVFVGSTLVDMYAKCGSLVEAQEVLTKLPVRNVVSWNALIAGYAEHGPCQDALECFEVMQLEGISPDAVSYVCALKACGSLGAIERGREIQVQVAVKGLERDVFVGNMLVDMHARCGSLAEAQEIFNNLPTRNVVTWNTLITGYAERGPCQEVLKCFEQMQIEGIPPNSVTFICVLKACGSIGALDKGREVHGDIAQKGFGRDDFVRSTLIDMYAKCGSLSEAHEVFGKLSDRDVVSWNALIAGHAKHGLGHKALKCFEQMQLECVSPNAYTFASVLKACGSLGVIDKGREIHADIAQRGFERDVFVGSSLVDMYAKCGFLAEAQEVFDKLPVQNVVSWTALIAGYTEQGTSQKALKCFEQMRCEGVSPNSVTVICILKACSSIGALEKGREMHADIAQMGLENDVLVGNALVDMYAKFGLLVEAWEIFDRMPLHNVVSWNALIAGCSEHGAGQEAVKCFEQMQLEGESPNATTYVSVLKACGGIGAIDKGRDIHTHITQKGFERDVFVSSALVDMYAKCGSLPEAREVFGKLPVQDIASWNAMIKGYGLNHEFDMAVQCFEDMQEQGVKPDDITFTCLLTACSRARLVTKGQELFDVMRQKYGIAPTIDHCICMVDLLAKSGQLYEAKKFLETMPCPPAWTALLSACKTYGEVELGWACFQQLVHMDPEGAAAYVLMANIYSSAGRWDEAYRIEELRQYIGANKKLASASIEVNMKVHEFFVGNNENKEIAAMLEILSSRMKEEGHVPNVNLVMGPMSDDENKTELCEHFPVALGNIDTPQWRTLHVNKNLRMCNDCHDSTKYISRIERQEIVVQDVYHVHHYKEVLRCCSDMC